MKVRLIAITQPVIDLEDADDLIAYCAKVSNPAKQDDMTNAAKLRDYLMTNRHYSPLEMVSATVEVITDRAIARQMLRHRSFSFQEFSQRYSDQIEFTEPHEARRQDTKNRQNSIDDLSIEIKEEWEVRQDILKGEAAGAYQWALQNGIAKECARVVLPEGLTVSRLYMAGTFRSWLHYIELREGNGTQLEHQRIAIECRKVLSEYSDIF